MQPEETTVVTEKEKITPVIAKKKVPIVTVKKQKAPSVIEPPKKLLLISQSLNSPTTKHIVDFFASLNDNTIKYIDKSAECFPGTDNTSATNGKLEEQMKRLGASLFIYVTASKDKKVRIAMGRSHEYEITDICHFHLTVTDQNDNSIKLGASRIPSGSVGLLAVIRRSESARMQNLILDIFRSPVPSSLGLTLCAHALGVSFSGNSFDLEVMQISHSPFSLTSISPRIHLTSTSSYHCSEEEHRASKVTVRQTEKKIKNVEKGPLNSILGTIHIEKQDLSELKLCHGKAHKKRNTDTSN